MQELTLVQAHHAQVHTRIQALTINDATRQSQKVKHTTS